MTQGANVQSIETLKQLRRAMWKFAESATAALGDAEGEMNRTMTWLETEMPTYWQSQVRKRHEIVERCKEAVRMKKLYKSPTGHTQSAVEEEKALRIAQRRFEEAEHKLLLVRQHSKRLHKEIQVYHGSVQRFSTGVQVDVPLAVGKLDNMIINLERYASLSMPEVATSDASGAARAAASLDAGKMTRAAETGVQPPPVPAELRLRTPPPELRAAAEPSQLARNWKIPILSQVAAAAVAMSAGDRHNPEPADRVVMEKAVEARGRLYLQRLETSEGDSGWYIGSAEVEPGEPKYEHLTVAQLLEVRPDFAGILPMRSGFLVVMNETGVESILDWMDREQWSKT